MQRYWFRWKAPEPRLGGAAGCGVTAVDLADAESLIRSMALRGEALPPVAAVDVGVDVESLALGETGDPDARGVWYPRVPRPADLRCLHVDRDERFALELDPVSGRAFVSVAVDTHHVTYEERYEVDRETFDRFRAEPGLARPFVARARNGELDHLLLLPRRAA